jgi:hypothetical protein
MILLVSTLSKLINLLLFIFSEPETLKAKVHLKERLDSHDIEIGKDDQFAYMLKSFLR